MKATPRRHRLSATCWLRPRSTLVLVILLTPHRWQTIAFCSHLSGSSKALNRGFRQDTAVAVATPHVEALDSVVDHQPRSNYNGTKVNHPLVDTRPHEQRATRPRAARRLNHAFRYLFRHDADTDQAASLSRLTSLEFLVQRGGYTREQVYKMNNSFPPLLDLDVRRHLWPKLRFLQHTLGLADQELAQLPMPPQYFGARLERTIAPRHAFLVYQNLPHGRALLTNPSRQREKNATLWQIFLQSCRNTKQFCALCNSWQRTNGSIHRITPKQIEAFDVLFQRGLMAAARDELCQWNNTWPLEHLPNMTSADMMALLLQHGANPLERDVRGTSLMHWAAGTGNLGCVKQLVSCNCLKYNVLAERDGATPLHWAAAGAKAREFGCGGHVDVCQYLLEQADSSEQRRTFVNQRTKDGNSALMWAAWSGSLDTVKLLVRNRANVAVSNRNGCTVAHWASSGGNLQVCRYLAETAGVDFSVPNRGGNTPLTHAVAFGRAQVVEWLRSEICISAEDIVAAELARDFVGWERGNANRKRVLSLFDDWYGVDLDDGAGNMKKKRPILSFQDDMNYF